MVWAIAHVLFLLGFKRYKYPSINTQIKLHLHPARVVHF
jgi:hypothetical protein